MSKVGRLPLYVVFVIAAILTCCDYPTGLSSSIQGGNNRAVVGTEVTPLQVYGVWHAGNDECTWGAARGIAEFDSQNHWLIDRGDGVPSVNLVVLSFVNPLKLLDKTTDGTTLNGIPAGMTQEVVDYFRSNGIRVMLSIGGITYTDDWDEALATDATQLGLNAAEAAQGLGVGIEIDYEASRNPDLDGLQAFIDAYRSQLPYDASGNNQAARLTIDLAAGDRWLIDICQKATADWLNPANPVLDYANAMVPARQPRNATVATDDWAEHVDGKPQYNPPIPPLAPAKFTGALYITGRKVPAELTDFYNSLQYEAREFVQSVLPNGAGTTPGMLGYMFWAAERPAARFTTTTPPTTGEGGVGEGAKYFDISIPMQPLRQE